jgi:hypothetical protein
VIADILPPPVAAAFGDPPDAELYPLYPGEEAVIAHTVDNRRREFATGRACARTALAQLGVPGAAILPGARGAPQWPAGVMGSITHGAGYRACAVGSAGTWSRSAWTPNPMRASRRGAARGGGRGRGGEGPRAPGGDSDGVLGSPAVQRQGIGLQGLVSAYRRAAAVPGRQVDFDSGRATFSARLLVDGPVVDGPVVDGPVVDGPVVDGAALTGLDGRWVVGDGLLATAIVVPRRASSSDG